MRNLNSFLPRLNLDPGTPEGGGGAGAAGAGTGGASAGAGEGAAPSYLTESRFTEFSTSLDSRFGELQEMIRGLTPAQQAAQDRQERGDNRSELIEPNIEDAKYTKDAKGFAQYQRDMVKYAIAMDRQDHEAKQGETRQQQEFAEYIETVNEGHAERVAAIRAEIPNYDQRMAGARFGIPADSRLGLAIKSSDYSPRLMLELKENPETLARIKKAAKDYGVDRAIAIIGRLESKYEAEKTTVTNKTRAAGAMPTRGGFPGGSGSSSKKKTDAEVMAQWN